LFKLTCVLKSDNFWCGVLSQQYGGS
jgi:hypothetical protein